MEKADTIVMEEIRMRGRGIPAALAGGVLAATIALAPCPAFGQAKGVFAPYASRLAAEPAGQQVKLTWKDSSDVAGTYSVYRHTAEISSQNVGGALVVGRVGSGVEYFIDTPPDTQEYFYALLLEDSSNKRYSVFVPFRNTTVTGIAVAAPSAPEAPTGSVAPSAPEASITPATAIAPDAASAPEASSTPEPSSVPEPASTPAAPSLSEAPSVLPTAPAEPVPEARITDIRAAATADGQAIEVSFRSSDPSRDLLVFWGASPMTSAEDLLRSTSKSQLDPGEARYTVPALPGVDAYFAVVDAGQYKLGQAPLVPGQNATVVPVHLPLGPAGEELPSLLARRPLPLPGLDISSGVQTGLALPESDRLALPQEKAVSPETSRAIAEILSGIGDTAPAPRGKQILASEASPVAASELSGLQAIVQGAFSAGDLRESERQLRNFLSLTRPPDLEGRARFYLGQTYYLQDRPREALLEFLLAENVLYPETAAWKDACFRRLAP